MTEVLADESAKTKDIENILNPYVEKTDLPEDYGNYIANMIQEDPPRSDLDLRDSIGEFFRNDVNISEDSITQFCKEIFDKMTSKNLINNEGKMVWVAEKLNKPILMAEVELITDKEHDEGYTETPFSFDRFAFKYNDLADDEDIDVEEKSAYLKRKDEEKKKKEEDRKKKKDKMAFERHLAKMNQMRNTLPEVQVDHKQEGTAGDIQLEDIDLEVPGKILLSKTNFIMNRGRKYGLIGRNGIGKTTLLYAICRREFPGMENCPQVLLVEQEVKGNEKTVIETILEADLERKNLMLEEQKIKELDREEDQDRLSEIYERLIDIEANKAESKARILLNGLGFTPSMQEMPTNLLSGGWRMRVALAKVLFCEPEILLLDEPTNHLDLDAVMWLQDYLINWDKTLLVVSHARDFLNNVCTDIVHFADQQLGYFKGNYDNFEKIRDEQLNQSKRTYEAQQKKMSHVQEFIDKFRFNAKRASLVQSRIKYLNKLEKVEKVLEDPTTIFIFENPDKLRPPIIRIDDGVFGYTPETTLLKNLAFSVDQQSKVALLGANGVGKTTLLKLLTQDLELRSGNCYKNGRARIATYSQHLVEDLDITLSPFEQFIKKYPKATTELIRGHLSRFGVVGSMSLRPIYLLSGGQKARVALALTAWGNPHVMIMDEPTNHLDIEAVDALIVALSNFTGGLLLVSHDQYFVSCICDQIWYIKDQKLKRFNGGFDEYRNALVFNKL